MKNSSQKSCSCQKMTQRWIGEHTSSNFRVNTEKLFSILCPCIIALLHPYQILHTSLTEQSNHPYSQTHFEFPETFGCPSPRNVHQRSLEFRCNGKESAHGLMRQTENKAPKSQTFSINRKTSRTTSLLVFLMNMCIQCVPLRLALKPQKTIHMSLGKEGGNYCWEQIQRVQYQIGIGRDWKDTRNRLTGVLRQLELQLFLLSTPLELGCMNRVATRDCSFSVNEQVKNKKTDRCDVVKTFAVRVVWYATATS